MPKRVIICLVLPLLLAVALAGTARAEERSPEQKARLERAALHALKRGWQYYSQDDLGMAEKRFHQATILDPDWGPGYFGKAMVYSRQGRWELALEYYKKTRELTPKFPHAWGNAGLVLLNMGRVDEAEPFLRKALELGPKESCVYENMAVYYFKKGRYDQAWEYVAKSRELGGRIDPRFLHDLKQRMPPPGRAGRSGG